MWKSDAKNTHTHTYKHTPYDSADPDDMTQEVKILTKTGEVDYTVCAKGLDDNDILRQGSARKCGICERGLIEHHQVSTMDSQLPMAPMEPMSSRLASISLQILWYGVDRSMLQLLTVELKIGRNLLFSKTNDWPLLLIILLDNCGMQRLSPLELGRWAFLAFANSYLA